MRYYGLSVRRLFEKKNYYFHPVEFQIRGSNYKANYDYLRLIFYINGNTDIIGLNLQNEKNNLGTT